MGWLDKLKKKKTDVRGEIEQRAYQEQQLKEAEKMGRWRAQQEGKQRRKAPAQGGGDRFARVFGGFQSMAETGGRVNQFMLGGPSPKPVKKRRRKPKYVWVKVRR